MVSVLNNEFHYFFREVSQPKKDVTTVFKNLDHDIADQLRKASIVVSEDTPGIVKACMKN